MSPDQLVGAILALLCLYAAGVAVFVAAIWKKQDPNLKGIEVDC